jgi:hypothetical protein
MFRACAAVIRAGLLCVLVFCLSILFFLLSARLATRYTIPQCSAGPLTTRHTASPLPCKFASSIFPLSADSHLNNAKGRAHSALFSLCCT